MARASELLQQAAQSRHMAKRAHRLAGTVNGDDRQRLVSYGDELLEQASSFERQAGEVVSTNAGMRVVPQKEQQPQQRRELDRKRAIPEKK